MNTKEKIIRISLKAFLEHGYDHFSMRDVGKAVGIKQPTIYYYFEDKLSLFRECTKVFFEQWHTWMVQSVPEDTDLKGFIKSTCMAFGMDRDILYTLYGTRTEFGQYRLILDIVTYCPESLNYMKEFNAHYFALLEKQIHEAKKNKQIRESVKPESVYGLLGSLMEGSNIMRITDPDFDFAQENERIFDMIWNGMVSSD